MFRRFFSISALALLGCLVAGCEHYGSLGAGSFDTVVIDPGHGGHDFGGRSLFGRNEKDLALDTAQRLKTILQRRGFRVVITRNADYFISLGQRVNVSNATSNCIFVSIHYNWDRRRSGHGMETYYYQPRAARLAANVEREIAAVGSRDRGVKQRGFYVLRKNRRPAILVECGFVSNPRDNTLAQSPAGRQRLAEAIARGIVAERRGVQP